jgi:V/A-type H+-transporting ATPase subunit D
MIHPTRTELLLLRKKAAAVAAGAELLKARRQALVREFLGAIAPFLDSREALRARYRQALDELSLSRAHEGAELHEALAAEAGPEAEVEIAERNVMGVRCRELTVTGTLVRPLAGRGYDYAATTSHLEEAIFLFETIATQMLEVAAWENRLKRLGEEIRRVTTRTRILEERVLPGLRERIHAISQQLAEREREALFRLKRFKERRAAARRAV